MVDSVAISSQTLDLPTISSLRCVKPQTTHWFPPPGRRWEALESAAWSRTLRQELFGLPRPRLPRTLPPSLDLKSPWSRVLPLREGSPGGTRLWLSAATEELKPKSRSLELEMSPPKESANKFICSSVLSR